MSEERNVLSLFGGEAQAAVGEPHPEIIWALEKLLEQARTGVLQAISVGAIQSGAAGNQAVLHIIADTPEQHERLIGINVSINAKLVRALHAGLGGDAANEGDAG
jgi:hypothetical protein